MEATERSPEVKGAVFKKLRSNIYREKFKLFKTHSPGPFSAYTTVNKHRRLVLEHYHHSKRKRCTQWGFFWRRRYFYFFIFQLSRGAYGNSVPQPGIEPMLPAGEPQSVNYWTPCRHLESDSGLLHCERMHFCCFEPWSSQSSVITATGNPNLI